MKRTLLLFAFVGVFGTANADLLYNQPVHTPGASGGNGYSSHSGLDRWLADDFTNSVGWVINQVDITFVRNSAEVISGFKIEFFTDNAGLPGTSLGQQTSTSWTEDNGLGGTYFGRAEKRVLVDINPVTLGPGHYWMAAQFQSDGNIFWLTAATVTGNESATFYSDLGQTGWTAGTSTFGVANDLAYSLHGSPVPEPASMIALATGAVALLRRRRSSK